MFALWLMTSLFLMSWQFAHILLFLEVSVFVRLRSITVLVDVCDRLCAVRANDSTNQRLTHHFDLVLWHVVMCARACVCVMASLQHGPSICCCRLGRRLCTRKHTA
jgi:hypothetical protein